MARTVTLLAVDTDEMSRTKAGRSACSGGGGGGCCGMGGAEERAAAAAAAAAASSTLVKEACEAWVLVLGEGLDEAGVEWGMGDA